MDFTFLDFGEAGLAAYRGDVLVAWDRRARSDGGRWAFVQKEVTRLGGPNVLAHAHRRATEAEELQMRRLGSPPRKLSQLGKD